MVSRLFVFLLVTFQFFVAVQQAFSQTDPWAKYKKIQQYMNRATNANLAGVVVYINHPTHGEWIGVSGYANRNEQQLLQSDNIFSLASIGKTYTAVTVMKLAEEGRLRLDDSIEKYLPAGITTHLPNASQVSLRHLLGHTSGWVNYENDTALVNGYLAGRIKLDTLRRTEVLRKYVFDKPALFPPGTQYNYSSTNYLLLALVIDAVVPEGHSDYMRKWIHQQGFTNTYYRQTPPQKNVSYYGYVNKDGVSEDLTAQTFETTNWFTGDDGVYAPIAEAAHFLQDLVNGKILSPQSLKEMQTWNNPKKPDYGLGLMADKSFPYKFLLGHSGRGIGVTTDLYYFPSQDITVAIFCNTGLRGAAPEFRKTYIRMRTKIVKKLFLF